MGKDLNVIRKIILAVGAADSSLTKIDEIPAAVFLENAVYLIENNFVNGETMKSTRNALKAPILAEIRSLKERGRKLLKAAKNDELWDEVKNII